MLLRGVRPTPADGAGGTERGATEHTTGMINFLPSAYTVGSTRATTGRLRLPAGRRSIVSRSALSVRHRTRAMSTHTLADGLYESLKRQIVENKIEPGTILTEHGIAALHSVSRAPAREALKRLVASGFASARRRVGYIVPHVSVADVDEVYALRLLLEPAATALAVPRLTEADMAVLDDLAAGILRVAAAPVEEHGALYSRLNAEFHREIARVSGNGRLERTITSLIDELERVMHMLAYSATMASVLEEHAALMRVMRSGDAARAAALMRQQLEHDYGVTRALVTGRGQR